MNDVLSGILDFVVSVPPVWRTLLAGLAIFFETTILAGLIVPGDTVVIVSATGVTTPLQFVALALTVIVGALCGESVGFYLGRWFGPRIRASRLGRRLGEKNWVRAERYLARRGGIAVFLSRFLPVLHSLIPLTVGMSGMRYRTFMAWTTPACILWSFAYVGVGAAAAGGYRELSDSLHYAGYLFVGAIVLFALVVFGAKKLLKRAEARHLDE
ncbi:DedA family protein [Rathayibacter sp. VKM Ac-2754]|uniref:DedA family protein n=1 Tax=Rathayibacter sp. VKM Ac-2754 TaxID=2609251 RepID=UPI00135AA3CB|nr:DedA family protein [Rathayibacter sp. VKM Ac-2754]MWV60454.1 DedA family protein [Rathayibacter sp. VKM Ac-2754]